MSAAKHTPGPWEAIPSGYWTGTWRVRRENPAKLVGFEFMCGPAGRPSSFRSEAAARAAIAKATAGSAS